MALRAQSQFIHRLSSPSLLQSLYPQSHFRFIARRQFSASCRRDTNPLDFLPQCADSLLQGLRTVGLPWYLVLPSAAVLVRGGLVWYLATRPNRRQAQIRTQLVPLSLAQASQDQILSSSLSRDGRPTESSGVARTRRSMKSFFTYQRHLVANSFKFGVPAYTIRTPINLLVLLLFSDVIRQKCGANSGLWSLLMGPFRRLTGNQEEALEQVHQPEKSQETQSLEWLAEKQEMAEQAASQIASADIAHAAETSSSLSPYFEPSMTTGGLPWCLDLTAADPYFILPGLLGATMFASVFIRRVRFRSSSSGSLQSRTHMDRPLNIIERITLSFGLLLTMASTQWPAALLLYFVPSITVGWVQQLWLDRKMPLSAPMVLNQKEAARKLREKWAREGKEKMDDLAASKV